MNVYLSDQELKPNKYLKTYMKEVLQQLANLQYIDSRIDELKQLRGTQRIFWISKLTLLV